MIERIVAEQTEKNKAKKTIKKRQLLLNFWLSRKKVWVNKKILSLFLWTQRY